MQKTYWSTYCHKIGYAPRRNKKQLASEDRDGVESIHGSFGFRGRNEGGSDVLAFALAYDLVSTTGDGKSHPSVSAKQGRKTVGKSVSLSAKYGNGHAYDVKNRDCSKEPTSSSDDTNCENEQRRVHKRRVTEISHSDPGMDEEVTTCPVEKASGGTLKGSNVVSGVVSCAPNMPVLDHLKEENRQLKERLEKKEDGILGKLQCELQQERDNCKSLERELQEVLDRIEELNKEQESLIDIFSEERDRRDIEEENLRKRLRDASNLIEQLRDRVRLLERKR
ncbi:hypothetical protein KSS87_015148 [Heliosperma pusillum]|nr:hypothetical protein KSS87_015148 [Heliosperma pusillum]